MYLFRVSSRISVEFALVRVIRANRIDVLPRGEMRTKQQLGYIVELIPAPKQ